MRLSQQRELSDDGRPRYRVASHRVSLTRAPKRVCFDLVARKAHRAPANRKKAPVTLSVVLHLVGADVVQRVRVDLDEQTRRQKRKVGTVPADAMLLHEHDAVSVDEARAVRTKREVGLYEEGERETSLVGAFASSKPLGYSDVPHEEKCRTGAL